MFLFLIFLEYSLKSSEELLIFPPFPTLKTTLIPSSLQTLYSEEGISTSSGFLSPPLAKIWGLIFANSLQILMSFVPFYDLK